MQNPAFGTVGKADFTNPSALLQALQTNSTAKTQGGASPHEKEGGDTVCPITAGSGAVILSNRHHPEPMELQGLIAGLCYSLQISV